MQETLQQLTERIRRCQICAERFKATATHHSPRPVLYTSETARLLIAGQAPGLRVHESGVPFDDASGDRLRDWMGVDRETFYDHSRIAIVPMAFCFPGYDAKGSDLPPPPICAKTWRIGLMEAMPQIETVLLVGGYAQKWHLGRRAHPRLTETVQHWREYTPHFLPMPHPSWRNTAWLKRNPWFEEEVLPWLRARVQFLLG